MILDIMLWLPCKVLGHFLQPVTAMLDSLAANANQAVEDNAREHDV